MQSLKEDTKAKGLMGPFSPNSYAMAVKSLKERFGREDLIIEVNVRALLQLVLQTDKKDLAVLFDKINTHVKALECLKVTADKYAVILCPLIESALPIDVLKHWERQRSSLEVEQGNPLHKLMKFLENEVRGEERSQLACSFAQEPLLPTASTLISTGKQQFQVPKRVRSCLFCGRDHIIERCFKAQKMTLEERKEVLHQKKACARCCVVGHDVSICRSQVTCIICSDPHLALICPSLKKKQNREQVTSTLFTSGDVGRVYLQTLRIKAIIEGRTAAVRVLLDSAADRSYIKEDVANKLELKQSGCVRLKHSVFGGVVHKSENHNVYNLTLVSDSDNAQMDVELVGIHKICSNILPVADPKLFGELTAMGIQLSDVRPEDASGDIDILLGSNYMAKLLTTNMKHTNFGPLALQTRLGWVLMGGKRQKELAENDAFGLFNMIWELGAIGIHDPIEVGQEREVVETMDKDVSLVNGRYQVSLLWKSRTPSDNRRAALSRLENITDKLKRQKLVDDYDHVFSGWLDLGVIERVPTSELERGQYYLPHRPVIKESANTKIRPVFDASAKSQNGLSLNECLEAGPNMIARIPSLISRFRLGKIGVSSDIAKAFLQISVKKNDRDFLRFFWWDEKERLIELRHTRVVFGITSSPCHLGVVIAKHLRDHEALYKQTVEVLKTSFYVDNVLTAVNSMEEYKKFKLAATHVMNLGKFTLCQWARNRVATDGEEVGLMGTTNILGLLWDLDRDTLGVRVPLIPKGPLTKRRLLSLIQSIFDVLGFWCPALIQPKVALQATWKRNLDWEDELPEDVATELAPWIDALPLLSQCVFPRYLPLKGPDKEFHVFCDASSQAYAACIFLRVVLEGVTTVRLIRASNRIAPIERLSIPRLELLAATIATRLYKSVCADLNVESTNVHFWSDSQVVLNWVKRDRPWKRFVKNRVDEIRKLPPKKYWRFVPGHLNPADLPSRGCNASQLLKTQWWYGPDWLKLSEAEWPPNIDVACPEAEEEKEAIAAEALVTVCSEPDPLHLFRYFSNYHRIVRMIAYILRFKNRNKGEISSMEYVDAEIRLLRYVQCNSQLSAGSTDLQLFKDEIGLLRVITRIIDNADVESFQKPILLPEKNVIVERLIESEHKLNMHASILQLMVILRQKFWVIRGRRTVKSVVNQCMKCKRQAAKQADVPFAPLPLERTAGQRAFQHVGCDLMGPLIIDGREKVWVVMFTCATFRAVHFEIARHLSTVDLILAIRRCMARRGRFESVFCDNGTNLVGADNLLGLLDWTKVEEALSLNRIVWVRHPPTASWWGGFFERVVAMLKNVLRKCLGGACLSYDELHSVVCDAESVINSRPLTRLEGDPKELSAITPNFFLHAAECSVADFDEVDAGHWNRRVRFVQSVRDELRTRFRNEYVSLLVNRGERKYRELEVGEIVLVECEGKSRFYWPLGKIEEVLVGRDGNRRVAIVKTAKGLLKRPFPRLAPLEVRGATRGVDAQPLTDKTLPAAMVDDQSSTR